MPHVRIASLEDPRLAVYRDLPKSNLTPLSGKFVVEGRLLVERLAASHYPIDSVVVDERQLGMVPGNLPEDTPVYVLPAKSVEHLIGFNFHRGILACGRRLAPKQIQELRTGDANATPLVVCVDIQDPTNLGGILRNCAAFGIQAVVLSNRCADPFSRRVLRVSMGTVFKLALYQSSDILPDLDWLRGSREFELIATVLDPDAEPLDRIRRVARSAILFGNEAHGLPPSIVALCQRRVTIPMELNTDSLNAASASAVVLYQFTRVARGV